MAWTNVDTEALAANDDPGDDLCKRAADEINRLNKLLCDREARIIGDAGNSGYEVQKGSRYTSR